MNDILLDMDYKSTPIDSVSTIAHAHSGYQFILIVSGEVTIDVSGNTMRAKAPCVVLLNALEEHTLSDSTDDYARYLFILNENNLDLFNMNNSFIELMKFRPDSSRSIIDISDKTTEITDIFKTIYHEWKNKSPYFEDKIANSISNLVIELHRIVYKCGMLSKIPKYILDIQNYLEKNYSTVGNISDICDMFFVNKFYLSRVFKNITGYTPKEYLTLIRLSKAKKLLLTSNNTVNEICYNVGFRDINNFIKLFKEKYSVPPLRFRKLNKS